MGQEHYLVKYEIHKCDEIYNKTEKDIHLCFGIVLLQKNKKSRKIDN